MSLEFYKIIHILGIILLFIGLSTVMTMSLLGSPITGKAKSIGFITHGLGLTLIIISGFGMAAKIGLHGIPNWLWIKIGIWIYFGAAIALAKRKGYLGWPLVILFAVFGTTAALLGLLKPF